MESSALVRQAIADEAERKRVEAERDRALSELRALALRLAAIAELGRRALGQNDLDALIEDAVSLVVQVLGVDCCEVLELAPAGDSLRLRAGLGWHKGVVGQSCVEAGAGSLAAQVLATRDPLVVSDLAADARFRPPRLHVDHGIVGGVTVAIAHGEQSFGLLGAHSRWPRAFSAEDARFLEAVANVLGGALERERARAALRSSERRFRALIDNSSDAIALLDRDAKVLWASSTTHKVLGYTEAQLVGRNAYELIHPDDLEATRRSLDRLHGNPGGSATAEYRVQHSDGAWRWVEGVATNLLHEPGVEAVVNNYRDITKRKQREKRIRHQAQHDPLTELPNRVLFADRLEQSLARSHRSGRSSAVAFCDLDHFKRVNDSLGHAAGDELLKAVAERLRAVLREDDTIGRMGGDEFTLIFQDLARPEDAGLVARKILAALSAPVDVGRGTVHVTASLGISLYPQDGTLPKLLLSKADDALYRAKALGRNRFELSAEDTPSA